MSTIRLLTPSDTPTPPRDPVIRVRDLIEMLSWVDPDAYVLNARREPSYGVQPLDNGGRKVVVVR